MAVEQHIPVDNDEINQNKLKKKKKRKSKHQSVESVKEDIVHVIADTCKLKERNEAKKVNFDATDETRSAGTLKRKKHVVVEKENTTVDCAEVDKTKISSDIIDGSCLIESSNGKSKKGKKRKRERKETFTEYNNCEGESCSASLISSGLTGETPDMDIGVSPRKKRKGKNKERIKENNLITNEMKTVNADVVSVQTDNECIEKLKSKRKKKPKRTKDTSIVTEVNDSIDASACKDSGSSPQDAEKNSENINKQDVENKKRKKMKLKKKHKSKETDEDERTSFETVCDNKKHRNKHEKKNNQVIKFEEGKPVSSETNGVAVGQWQTADFEDSDRQNKFFKLLGGYKKGCDKNLLGNKFSIGCSNGLQSKMSKGSPPQGKNDDVPQGPRLAMSKIQEKLYTIALESQYEKALAFNQQRGKGLGYEKKPEEGKKFHIDVKKSKSVKFSE